MDYEKARVCNLSQALTDEKIFVAVDLFGSEVKSETWAEEQLKLCDYFLIIISESYFQFVCQQHANLSPQASLPKLRPLEGFVNELPNRTIVVSFTSETNNIIPPVLADVDLIQLMDMPKLSLQKNFEQLLRKLRPGYDSIPEECPEVVVATDEVKMTNGEVTEEVAPTSDEIGELKPLEKKKEKKKEKPMKLALVKQNTDLNVCRPRRSVNMLTTPLITPGIQQTSELSIAGKNVIDLSYKDITELPCDLPYHEDLHVLWLSNNKLSKLDVVKVSALSQLEELYAHCNMIQEYPIKLCDCFTSLRILWLSTNDLKDLPESFRDLTALRHLHLCENDFTAIPDCVLGLRNLKVLYMNHNHVTEVTCEISQIESLERLYLNDNVLEKVSNEITKLTKLRKVMMLDNNFYAFPDFISDSKLLFNLAISSIHDPNLSKIRPSKSTPQFGTKLKPNLTRPRLSDN